MSRLLSISHHLVHPFTFCLEGREEPLDNVTIKKTIAVVTSLLGAAAILASQGIGIVGVGLALGCASICFYATTGCFKACHVVKPIPPEVPNDPLRASGTEELHRSIGQNNCFTTDLSEEGKKYAQSMYIDLATEQILWNLANLDFDKGGETPAFIDRVIANISKSQYAPEQIIHYVVYLISFDQTIDCPDRPYLTFRFLNHYCFNLAQDIIKNCASQNSLVLAMKRIRAPGDGNCFLWSCVIALKILKSQNPNELVGKVDWIDTLKLDQDTLRKNMAELFQKKIESTDASFRERWIQYIFGNEAFTSFAPQDKREEVNTTEGKYKDFIEPYLALIEKDGSWNGEFEAALVAEIMERPIVILSLQGEDYKFRTVAGDHYSNTPLFVLHTGSHYDVLVLGF